MISDEDWVKEMRVSIKEKLINWGLIDPNDHIVSDVSEASMLLCKLFGFESYYELVASIERDEELVAKFKLLDGPYGYTVLKVLLARVDE